MDLISVGRVLVTIATVTAYIAYFVWRVRRRRARQDTAANPAVTAAATPEERLARAIATAARLSGEAPKVDVIDLPADAPMSPPSTPPLAPLGDLSSMPPPAPVAAVADLLRGIQLPNDLAPLTTMAPRIGAADRVAFWTNTSVATVVTAAFLDALRAIGCQVAPLGVDTFSIERDGKHAIVNVYADGRAAIIDSKPGFPSVPENSFVVEVWTSS